MADSSDDEKAPTIAEDIVVTKYKMAAEMINAILAKVAAGCVVGAKIVDLCDMGDALITEETSHVFKKVKDMKKGIAFPTCISVNNCICHMSPLRSEPDVLLSDGDLVKIDMGCHIDGFPAIVAHSLVVGASADNPVTGRKADVLWAAHQCGEAAIRLMKAGTENMAVTDALQKTAAAYNCKPIEGMLSHQLTQHVIDGEKSIIQNPTDEQRHSHEKCEFDVHEVYAVDMLVSTGAGKGREQDARTTIYKRKDVTYQLKMKASRQFFSEMERKFHLMPFTLRSFEDEKKARMGVVECVKHQVVEPFGVLYEREGEFVAQYKFTVLLMPNGAHKITGLPFTGELYKTECSVEDPEIKELLAQSISLKAAKKKKKMAEKVAAAGAAEASGASAGPSDN